MKKHVNIPIFIPHLGCPNMCVFCNQRSISGKRYFDIQGVRAEIEQALSTVNGGCEAEIAYFGGSFTGIDRHTMICLLDIAQEFVDKPGDSGEAHVCGIRMSTRPDYIDEEIMAILSGYSVNTIELGIQSMNDSVLKACKRGHTAKDAENACRLVKQYNYGLVGQMMIGLPGADIESEKLTARKICEMGADGARIYPTVVFHETELADMARSGEYKMLGIDEAVERSCEVYEIFRKNNVECIRIGLCASDNLSDDSQVMGGANHPALGEMVLGESCFKSMKKLLDNCVKNDIFPEGKQVCFAVPKGYMSRAVGYRGVNKARLADEYKLRRVIVKEDDTDNIRLDSVF